MPTGMTGGYLVRMDGRPDPRSPVQARVAASAVVAWGGAAAFPVVLYVVVLNLYGAPGVLRSLLPAVVMALPAGLLRRQPLAAMTLMLAGSFSVTATLRTGDVGYSQAVVTALAVGAVAATARRRISIVALVATLAVQIAAVPFYTFQADFTLSSVAFAVLAALAAWTTGDSLRERRAHADVLRLQAAEQAVTAERLRIARELHDMIAHSIGVIAIQAAVGRRVMDTRPAEARNALDTIEATSRQTLAELRRVLGGLRRTETDPGPDSRPLDPAPTLADVDRIAAAARNAGIRVDVRWRGRRRPLPAHVDLSAFRIVQEALTNVLRHAGARECRVTVDHRDDELAIEVVDDGRHGGVAGTGYGIVGMRERVGLLHGEFSAGPRPEGGFRVAARLPLPAEV
jgi:signal transduction histidine kinase